MTRPLTTTEFRKALTIEVPRKMEHTAQRIFFDVGSQMDEAIVTETPVDTGYLRGSRAFTVGSDQPPALEKKVPKTSYTRVQPQPGPVLARAVKDFLPFTTGFRADYAKYVEDRVGMVKNAFARAGQMVRTAVANAQGDAQRGGA